MKIKAGFVMRELAGQAIAVAAGEASKTFHGMIKLNQTGRLVWEGVADGLSAEEIARRLTAEYAVDAEQALADVNAMLDQMEQAGILCR